MARNKKCNRFLALLLVFLLVVPIISFATSDTTGTDTTTDTTTDDTAGGNSGGAAAGDNTIEITDEQEEAFNTLAQKLQDEAVVSEKQTEINGHTFKTENDKYELYLNEEKLSILIRCKEDGQIIESIANDDEMNYQLMLTPSMSAEWNQFFDSGVVITVVEEQEQNRFGSASARTEKVGAKTAKLSYSDIEDGFKCQVTYEDYGISLEIEVYLTEYGVAYEIPSSSIEEGNTVNEKIFYLESLYVFPLMGKSMIDAREGYMFLPDGNGIIIDFEDNNQKYSSPWQSRVFGTYGDDFGIDNFEENNSVYTTPGGRSFNTANNPEKVTVPVYGMVYTDSNVAVLCQIEDGYENAYLIANMNGAQNQFWNYACARYYYRSVIAEKTDSTANALTVKAMQDERQTGDVKASFIITTGESASYAGMAIALRDKLLAEGNLLQSEDTSFKTRIDVLGADKENFLVFKRDVVMTTTDDVLEIVEDLGENGVTDLLVVYNGWQKGGVYNLPVTKFKTEGDIGGNSGMKDLNSKLSELGITLCLNTDVMRTNPDTSNTTYNTIKKMDKSTYEEQTFGAVYESMKILYPSVSADNLKSLAADMRSNDFKTIAVSAVTDQIFGYSRNSVEYPRGTVIDTYTEMIAALKEADMITVLDAPFSYLWKYTDVFTSMPLTGSDYVYTSEEVPFMTTVLKGVIPMYSEYVNFEANATEYFLKLVETGVFPSFYLTKESPSELSETNSNWIYSSEYAAYEEKIAEYAEKLKALDDVIDGSRIANHEVQDNVTITTYENGVKVYVNYGTGVNVDGIYIQANDYHVEAGEAK